MLIRFFPVGYLIDGRSSFPIARGLPATYGSSNALVRGGGGFPEAVQQSVAQLAFVELSAHDRETPAFDP